MATVFDMPTQTLNPGAAIKSLRKLAGLTLEDVAGAAETSTAYLSKVETGKLFPAKGYVAKVTLAIAESLRSGS